ncbi:MAG: hypothetical protein M1376_11405 [Planctomycetes bacterium]|nr:hypothetical protein [Planctomycetota bacterium]
MNEIDGRLMACINASLSPAQKAELREARFREMAEKRPAGFTPRESGNRPPERNAMKTLNEKLDQLEKDRTEASRLLTLGAGAETAIRETVSEQDGHAYEQRCQRGRQIKEMAPSIARAALGTAPESDRECLARVLRERAEGEALSARAGQIAETVVLG